MKTLLPVLALILAVGYGGLAHKTQSSCENAGMHWDATASEPKAKCNPAFA
jgi:hypothetical protein